MRFALAFLLAALALFAVLFVSSRRDGGSVSDVGGTEVVAAGPDDLLLAGPDRKEPAPDAPQDQGEIVRGVRSELPADLGAAEDAARLEVVVRSAETGKPMADLRVITYRVADDGSIDTRQMQSAGKDGVATFDVEPGEHHVGVHVFWQDTWLDEVSVAEGEHARVQLDLSEAGDETLFGRVELAGFGPLSGARVRVHSLGVLLDDQPYGRVCEEEGALWEASQFDPLATTTSAPGGGFQLPLRSWDASMLVVESEGAVGVYQSLGRLTTSEAVPLLVRLSPTTSLVVQVLEDGVPLPGAEVALEVTSPSRVRGQTVVQYETACAVAVTDAGGEAIVSRLPSEVPLSVRVRHGDVERTVTWMQEQAPDPSVLEVELGGRTTLRGRVEGASGRPVPDVPVECTGTGANATEVRRTVRTSLDGSFAFSELMPGPWRLKATPATDANVRVFATTVFAPAAEPVVLVVPDEERYISGTIVDFEGAPVRGRMVSVKGGEPQCSAWVQSSAEGDFLLGPLFAGDYDVSASTMRKMPGGDYPSQRVPAGTEGLVLRPEPVSAAITKGSLHVRFEPFDGTDVEILVYGPESLGLFGSLRGFVPFDELAAGTYAVSLRGDARAGFVEGVEVIAGATTEVFVRMEEGGELRVLWDQVGQVQARKGDAPLHWSGRDLFHWTRVPEGPLRLVVLHDGEDPSDPVTSTVSVISVPDNPVLSPDNQLNDFVENQDPLVT